MSKREKPKKEKKEKIIYIDDGSTVVDMSALSKKPKKEKRIDPDKKPRPRWMQIVKTYFDSMRLMLFPMLVVMGIIAIAFLILWILFTLAS